MDKIDFFGNFPRNVFCAFAVTLLSRPKKLDVGDHSCIAPLSCDDQSFAGRKVVLIGFFDNLHRRDFSSRHPPLAPPRPPQAKKLQRLAFTCASLPPPPRDVKRGRSCYTLASFQLCSIIITGFPRGLRRVKNPPQHCPLTARLLPDPPS